MMEQTQRDREIYNLAYEYLLSLEGVTPEILDLHLSPDVQRPQELADIYHLLLFSAQTANMGPSVIGKAIGGIDKLREVLCGFDPAAVAQQYGLDWESVLDQITVKVNPKGKIRRAPQSLWPRFSRTIVSGARFLAQFRSAEEFYKWVAPFDQDDRSRPALPMLLSYEIAGLGFPLACDFLMSLGYLNFGKPDVHVKAIFFDLQLSASRDDYAVFKAMLRVARSVGVTPLAVDHVFWLIGSGNFHRSGLQVGRHRDQFIAYASEQLGEK